MPIYEYHCDQCDHDIELLIRGNETPTCTDCGNTKLTKQLSVPATPNMTGAQLPMAENCGRPACDTGG